MYIYIHTACGWDFLTPRNDTCQGQENIAPSTCWKSFYDRSLAHHTIFFPCSEGSTSAFVLGWEQFFIVVLNGLNVDVKRCEKFEPLAVKKENCPTSWLACVWLKQYCHSHQIITLGKVWLYSEIRNLRTQIDRIVASISTHGCPPRCHCYPEMLRSCAATRRCSTGCHCCYCSRFETKTQIQIERHPCQKNL